MCAELMRLVHCCCTADTTRLRRANRADMGAREPAWAVRPWHERSAGAAV